MRMQSISFGKRLGLVGLVLLLGVAVGASSAQQSLITVLSYQDLVRFQIQKAGIEAAQVQIYDLSGNTIYQTGWSPGPTLDWPLITQDGRRVANGIFLYVIKTKNAQGQEQQWVGKLAVLDGVLQVGLPPELQPAQPGLDEAVVRPQHPDDPSATGGYHHVGDFTVQGFFGVNTTTPNGLIHVVRDGDTRFFLQNLSTTTTSVTFQFDLPNMNRRWAFGNNIGGGTGGLNFGIGRMTLSPFTFRQDFTITDAEGNVGIGTKTPQAKLEIRGSTTNLIRAVNSATGQAVFRVESDGDVYADGSYNCGLGSGCFNSGQGADVAERIDATEPLEPGDVVEIDPDNPGKFRKARGAMSRRVAGVISTAPAITLGNNFDPEAERWEDNRPLLALAGRVPVKAVAKFGAIEVGDLLVASPIPGYAMKCPNASECVGAIIGKALEPLREGVGLIEVQVMLR